MNQYQLVIIGGGPGGVAAGVYASRKQIKTLLITESFGGQSIVSADIQNWIGTKSISGVDLAQSLEDHVRAQEGIEVKAGVLAQKVSPIEGGFEVELSSGEKVTTRFILIASGSRRRKLGVPGEKELDGKGVAYCSTCDAPLFKGKEVVVVGAGNAGLEAVVDLLPYATKITILEFGDKPKGDPITLEKILKDPKVGLVVSAESKQILGEKFVTGMRYADRVTGEEKELPVQGVFVEIGALPNTEFVKGLVNLNPLNEIIADPVTQKTSLSGIWAVGDATDVRYKQNNISVGDGVKAVLNIYEEIHKN